MTTDSSASEVLSVIFPSIFLIFISSTISTVFNFERRIQIALEYVMLAIPQIFNITVLVPHIEEVIYLCAFISVIIVIFAVVTDKDAEMKQQPSDNSNIPFVTNVRSTINLITVVAILAVDFKLFPKQFKKRFKYGYSLMDVGVGLFIFANAIVAPEIKGYKNNSIKKNLIDSLPLIILGIGRYISVELTHYSVSITEYGKHWNFFMTLAVTRILSSFVLHFVGPKFSMVTGIFILIIHECLLQKGVADYVFGSAPRENLFEANREGIVSSLGFLGLYFLSLSIGVLWNLKEKEITSKLLLILKLLACSAILFPITFYLESYYFISRRLANSAYCFWILSLGVFMSTLLYVCELFQDFLYRKLGFKKCVHVPILYEAINYNGLLFFLVANVLTGMVNMTITTAEVSTSKAILILIVYMGINCVVALVLFKLRINLKFVINKIGKIITDKGAVNKTNV